MVEEKKNWFRRYWILTIIIFFLVLGIIFSTIFGGDANNKYCKELQKDTLNYLKSPATAKFQDCNDAVYSTTYYSVSVLTYVDSENSFGALIRTDIIGIAVYENNKLIPYYLKIDDEVIFDFTPKVGDEVIFDFTPKVNDYTSAIASNTQKGITLTIDDYKFERISEDKAKITELTFTLENKGSKTIYPDLLLRVYDSTSDVTKASSYNIDLSDVLYEGDYLHKTIITEVSVFRLNITKNIKLSAYEYGNNFVSVELNNVSFQSK